MQELDDDVLFSRPTSEAVVECVDRVCTHMDIHIKTSTGQSICCDVSPYDTLGHLRHRVERGLEEQGSQGRSDHKVVFAYHVGDDRTLEDHGLKDGSSVYVVRA